MAFFSNGLNYGPNYAPMPTYSYTPQPMGMTTSKPSDLLQVNGLEGARNYPVSPNCRVVLFDSNQDLFYIKSTDAGGYPSISAFTFAPVQEPSNTAPNYATKEDLQIVLDQINLLAKEVKENGKFTISKQSTTETSQ